MAERGASDLHLTSGSAPYLRIHGEMVKLNYKDVTPDVCQALILEILSEKQRENFLEEWDLDCSYPLKGVGRFRLNAFRQRRGVGAVFRRIPEDIQTIEELGLPEHLVQRAHIITIEDPIEFVHHNEQSLINQREVSSHTRSFHQALRAALREDPDVILVGELRDLETISLALTAAETGHLVLATLHTNSATKTVDRIIDVFPEVQQAQIRMMLSESLRGVVAQTLVHRADGNGRVPVIEVLVNIPAVANLIREGKTHQINSSMQTGGALGMITFEASVSELVRKGIITRQDGHNLLTRRGAAKTANTLRRA